MATVQARGCHITPQTFSPGTMHGLPCRCSRAADAAVHHRAQLMDCGLGGRGPPVSHGGQFSTHIGNWGGAGGCAAEIYTGSPRVAPLTLAEPLAL
ncbi:MAG: hypothetical protein CM15mP18_2700 [Methanobacteriota archaeon]|nr:MAG: hypothetical protein CM15mP18_2700 [Euryarchaeota archaeon]